MKVQLLFVTVCVLVALHICYSNAAATTKPATAAAPTTTKPTTAKPTTAAPTKAPTTGKPTTGKPETTKHTPIVTGSTGKHNGTTVKPPHTTTHKHSGSYQVTISLGTMFLLLCAVFAFNY